MKKLLFAALMLLSTSAVFAGDSEPLKAILKAQTYAEALDLLKANLAQITDNAEKARAYDKLYELDPTLKDNLSELPGRATYSDTAIGAFIYRDHLILTSRSFRIFSLSDMRWIYYTEKKTKYYGIITVATEYLLNVFSEIDNKHVNQAVSITNSKKLKTNIEELLGYIYSKYPHVIVGFNRETQAAYAVVKNNNN